MKGNPPPNATPVVLVGATCHKAREDHTRSTCGNQAGRPAHLVQVRVYLDVQWCTSPSCFGGREPW